MKEKMIKFLTAYAMLTKEQQSQFYMLIAGDKTGKYEDLLVLMVYRVYQEQFGGEN